LAAFSSPRSALLSAGNATTCGGASADSNRCGFAALGAMADGT
jgi:hypothetical protein